MPSVKLAAAMMLAATAFSANADDADTVIRPFWHATYESDYDFGFTWLHSVAADGNLYYVEMLIERGWNVNVEDEFGQTPLHYAVSGGHERVVLELVAAGANVTAADDFGQRPLHIALAGGHEGIIKALVEAGAYRPAGGSLKPDELQINLQ